MIVKVPWLCVASMQVVALCLGLTSGPARTTWGPVCKVAAEALGVIATDPGRLGRVVRLPGPIKYCIASLELRCSSFWHASRSLPRPRLARLVQSAHALAHGGSVDLNARIEPLASPRHYEGKAARGSTRVHLYAGHAMDPRLVRDQRQ